MHIMSQELVEIQKLHDEFVTIIVEYGKLHLNRQSLLKKERELDIKAGQIEYKQQNALKKLEEKYGVGQLNIETGEYRSAVNVSENVIASSL